MKTLMSNENSIGQRFFSKEYLAYMMQVFEERAERERISRDNYFMAKGIVKGKAKARKQDAVSLMKNGCSLKLIMDSLGFTKEELFDLARQNYITLSESQLGKCK